MLRSPIDIDFEDDEAVRVHLQRLYECHPNGLLHVAAVLEEAGVPLDTTAEHEADPLSFLFSEVKRAEQECADDLNDLYAACALLEHRLISACEDADPFNYVMPGRKSSAEIRHKLCVASADDPGYQEWAECHTRTRDPDQWPESREQALERYKRYRELKVSTEVLVDGMRDEAKRRKCSVADVCYMRSVEESLAKMK